MYQNISNSVDDIIQQIITSPFTDSKKKELLGIESGKLLPPLMGDIMAKHLYSPDSHPERFDSLIQRIMKDPTIKSNHSAANELPVEFHSSKRTVSDLSSWLSNGSFAALEFQRTAESLPFNRYDIYSSRMLLFCFSSDDDQKKGDIDYGTAKEVILVVLMEKSPDFLKNTSSPRYIHRFTDIISDTSVTIPLLKKIVFVQLDKALEQFLNKTYNKDEDVELLTELAMLADANNTIVKEAAMNNADLKTMYTDAELFSMDRDTRIALLQYEWAVSCDEYVKKMRAEREKRTERAERALAEHKRSVAEYERSVAEYARSVAEHAHSVTESERALAESERALAESERALAERKAQILAQGLEEGMEQGMAQGMAHINSLNAWLFENNRTEDVIKATSDPDYRAKLFKEYEEAHPQAE